VPASLFSLRSAGRIGDNVRLMLRCIAILTDRTPFYFPEVVAPIYPDSPRWDHPPSGLDADLYQKFACSLGGAAPFLFLTLNIVP
jgi:hypothetical protein